MEHAIYRYRNGLRAHAAALLLAASAECGAATIAAQTFNLLDPDAHALTAALGTGEVLPNAGSRNDDAALGLRFETRWYATRGNATGPATSGGDDDDIGVQAAAGPGFADLAPDGTPVSAGSEHNFAADDSDGRIELVFAPLDLRDYDSRVLSLAYWIADTSWEGADAFSVLLSDGATQVALLELDATGLSASRRPDQPGTPWLQLSLPLDGMFVADLDPAAVSLVVTFDGNSTAERMQLDDIVFSGELLPVPLPAALHLLLVSLAALGRSATACSRPQSD